jgi:type IV secretory pathway VirB6-like protein
MCKVSGADSNVLAPSCLPISVLFTYFFWRFIMKTFSIVSALASALVVASAFGGTAFASERDTPAASQAAPSTIVQSRSAVSQEAAAANAARARSQDSERAPFVFISQADKPMVQPLSRMAVRDEAVKSANMVADFEGLYSRG